LLAEGFSAADIYAAMFSRWSEARQANLPKLAVLSRAVAERPRIASIWSSHFPPRT
jgi:glutathione S-transferase